MRPDSSILWNALKGIVCVYKPAEVSVRHLRSQLINKLCKELSDLDHRLRNRLLNTESNITNLCISNSASNLLQHQPETSVLQQSELAQESRNIDLRYHPLVIGPRYLDEDLPVSWSNYLGYNTSGVLIFGLRAGTQLAKYIRENQSTRAYILNGVLGQATENGFRTGKVVERSTWKYIKQHDIQRILSSMQASHQNKVFEMCGIDMQSQLAYELAIKGPIRPANSKIPIIYGLNCVEFNGPDFTIEVQCINENEQYLLNLIHEIGLKLHSTAHTTSLKCIRHSCFTLEHALLTKHWNLENITKCMDKCNEMLNQNSQILEQDNVELG